MRTPRHKMGIHWIPVHQRPEDEIYAKQLAGSIKIINPDPAQIARALTYIDPNGVVVLRDHPMSEQKNDQMGNPVQTGIRHATEWNDKFNNRLAGLKSDRVAVCGINEPFVRDEAEELAAFLYTKAFLETCTKFGIRALALNLSVGWPRNLGKDMPPVWEPFLPLEPIILAGNHFLCVHEYWYDDPDESWFDGGSQGKWGWLAYRVNHCPLNVPIIIGECGMEKLVDRARWENEGRPPKGWIGNKSPAQYAEQLWRYAAKLNPNVFCIMPFTTDWGSHDWDSMDTLFAHNDIVSRITPAVWSNPYPSVGIPVPPPSGDNYILCWPKMTAITQFYGGTHSGLDLAMAVDTPVKALYNGIVAWVDWDEGGYGNYIRVYHPSLGFDSFYAHLNRQDVIKGQNVVAGQVIGASGNTGNSTGPHLHIEIRLRDEAGYRPNVSRFGKSQVDPLGVKYALGQIYGFKE